jgi:hypothetical protein
MVGLVLVWLGLVWVGWLVSWLVWFGLVWLVGWLVGWLAIICCYEILGLMR